MVRNIAYVVSCSRLAAMPVFTSRVFGRSFRYHYDSDEHPNLAERVGKYAREHAMLLDPADEEGYGY